MHPSQSQIQIALSVLLDYLQWNEFSLFGSNQIDDRLLAYDIRSKFNYLLESFIIYEDSLSDSKGDEIVRRLIKTQGVKNLLVIDYGDSLSTFQKFLKFRRIAKFGIYFVFLNQGIYTIDIEGALILSEPGTEGSTNEESFEFSTILNFLNNLEWNSLANLKRECPDQICFKNFNLVNIQNATRKIIGAIEGSVILTENPVFPGNNTSLI